MGRPSLYTPELADRICQRLAEGESLSAICRDEDMPDRSTVHRWMDQDETFRNDSTRAREMGCDRLAEQCLEIADTPELGEERTVKPDGSVETREGDMLQHRRLRIETRMRLIGKWSKRYGDKQQVEHSGTVGIADALRAAREKRRADEG